ncbi:MAG: hypothetical protein PHT12_03830 [Patescibacteria group bacterium]|nr:hypothetical protein [Patescibacteria group bacterium]
MKFPLLDKYRAWRNSHDKIDSATAAALFLAAAALAIAAGTFRWSWLIMDEQIQLRKDYLELKNQQDQLEMNYDAWNGFVDKKINEILQLEEDLKKK